MRALRDEVKARLGTVRLAVEESMEGVTCVIRTLQLDRLEAEQQLIGFLVAVSCVHGRCQSSECVLIKARAQCAQKSQYACETQHYCTLVTFTQTLPLRMITSTSMPLMKRITTLILPRTIDERRLL